MSEQDVDVTTLPAKAGNFARSKPDIWAAYAALGKACNESGPIDQRTQRLLKLALALAANSEGAVHSHARRAMEEGISVDELEHVAALAIPTIGFPAAMRMLTWVEDVSGT